MIYACAATVEKKGKGGVTTMQLPTFFLDSRVQGIVDEKHAEFIATEIINPCRLKTIKVNVRPQAADEQVYFSKSS